MDFYSITSFILTLAIIIAFLNHRYIKMQTTIAMMASSLIISMLLLLRYKLFGLYAFEQPLLNSILTLNFHQLLINGMLGLLLFAGALTIDFRSLAAQKWEILTLATFSTVLSAFLVGLGTYYLLPLLGIHLGMIYCLLFGALISPTDPIAVLATFKKLGAPKQLETTVAGESLFNDGVGIVLFITLYHVAFATRPESLWSIAGLFFQQAIGGIVYGLLLGYIGSRLIKTVDDPKVELLITIAIATGGYSLGQMLQISGPLAMVVAGIVIGSYGRKHALTDAAKNLLNDFWELIDELLNCVLFLLIGFELLVVAKDNDYFLAGAFAIPLVLLVRSVTVAIPIKVFSIWKNYCPHFITVLVWGGLRGGLAVALALSLPPGDYRQIILAMTYLVVSFSVIVQGLLTGPLVKLTKASKC